MQRRNFLIMFLVMFAVTAMMVTVITVGQGSQVAKLCVIPLRTNRVPIGTTFKINVTIANVTKLWGYQFMLEYNTTVLTATEFKNLANLTYSPFNLQEPSLIDDTAGFVAVAYHAPMGDDTGITTITAIPLTQITFRVDALGTSKLDINEDSIDFANVYGYTIAPRCRNMVVVNGVYALPNFLSDNAVVLEGGVAPQWLDPHVSYYPYDYGILQHSVEMLLWYNGSSSTQIIPWLTESWTPSYATTADTYTVKLRQGIKFQDGTPLNSTAVWFSLNRLLIIDGTSDTGVHGSQAAWILQQLLDTSLSAYFSGGPPGAYNYDQDWVKKVLDQKFVEIVDNYTFKINVKTRTSQFPYLFSGPWAAIVSPSEVLRKEYAFHNWGSPTEAVYNLTRYFVRAAGEGHTYYNVPVDGWRIGTGPYYLDSCDPVNYRVVLKVNSDYWGGPNDFQYPIGKPKLQEIDFNYVESFSTRLLDLKDGKATGIAVGPSDLYSVVDRDAWLIDGTFKSLIPDVEIHGPFTQFSTNWFNFITNTTDATEELRTFQPMADPRIRLAIACAVNLTEININVNNRLGQVANNLIPPGTAPQGSYDPTISPPWSYDLKKAAELLVDAMQQPLTSFTFYNGTAMPQGLVDNSFGDTNGDGKAEKPYNIEMYVGAADVVSQKILTTIATNLNLIARDAPEGNATGLTFSVVPVPYGQQYTLASRHQIYMYWGGWVADYNHVLDWLGPMYLSTGTYCAWNNINMTTLDGYVSAAYDADRAGDLAGLLANNAQANKFADDNVLSFYLFYPLAYFVRSSYLEGWYYNAALGSEYFAPMYYSAPSHVVISTNPSEGIVGTAVSVTGVDATPNGMVEIYWGSYVYDYYGWHVNYILIGTTAANSIGKFSFSFETPASTAGPHFIKAIDITTATYDEKTFSVQPHMSLDPNAGPVGTKITLTGTGFPYTYGVGQEYGHLMFDDQMCGTAIADQNGDMQATMIVPLASAGPHVVKALVIAYFPHPEPSRTYTIEEKFTVIDTTPLDVIADVGAIYFKGETAEFYIQVAFKGAKVDATSIAIKLNKPDGIVQTLQVQKIDTGLYKAQYTISGKGSMTGTYTSSIEAAYITENINAYGTTIKTFVVKPTWEREVPRIAAVSIASIGLVAAMVLVWRREKKRFL